MWDGGIEGRATDFNPYGTNGATQAKPTLSADGINLSASAFAELRSSSKRIRKQEFSSLPEIENRNL